MKRKKLFLFLILTVPLVVISLSYGVDGYYYSQKNFNRMIVGEQPSFILQRHYFKDGGSVIYEGLTYEILDLHRIAPSKKMAGKPRYEIGKVWKSTLDIPFRDNSTKRKGIRIIGDGED